MWTVKLDIKHNIAIVLYKATLPRALHWFYVLLPNKFIPCWKIICFLYGCHRCLALKLGHLVQLWRFWGLISKPSLAITRAQIRLTYKQTLCFGKCFFKHQKSRRCASVYSTAPCGHLVFSMSSRSSVERPPCVREVMGSIPVGVSDIFFVPRSCHVE